MNKLVSGNIEIIPLDRFNWEEVVKLEVAEIQKPFLPENIFSIAQTKFDNSEPYGIRYKNEFVGLIIYRNWNHVCWITRVMVDHRWQKVGIGSDSLNLFVKYLRSKVDCQEIRTTVSRQNIWGLYVFETAGFEMMGEDIDNEVVMRYTERS